MSDAWTPRLPRGVRLRHDKVRGRHVLLAPERIFEVDEVGLQILKRCDGRPLAQLVADLCKVFNAKPADIKGDLEDFLKDFSDKRVLDLQ